MFKNDSKRLDNEIRKGDLVVPTSKSLKKHHKGVGLVISVEEGGFWIYWNKRQRKTFWATGGHFLKRVDTVER